MITINCAMCGYEQHVQSAARLMHGDRRATRMEIRISAAIGAIVALCLAASAGAQQAAPDPLVRENATVRVAEHTYVIPDANVALGPERGHRGRHPGHAGDRPGPGAAQRRGGAAGGREAQQATRRSTLRPRTSTPSTRPGYLAFPAAAQVRQLDDPGGRVRRDPVRSRSSAFSGRSPLTAELLRDADGLPGRHRHSIATHTLDLGGVRVRFLVVGPTHTRGDTGVLRRG